MNRRKPYIVELTGTPEAGKTTVSRILYKALSNEGYKVKRFIESAEMTPSIFSKGSLEAKLWMNFETAQNLLEAQCLTNYDIVIFDRGAWDVLFWIYFNPIYNPEIGLKCSFLKSFLEQNLPDLLVAFYVSPEEAIKRRGGEGKIVTKDFVTMYNHSLTEFMNCCDANKFIIKTDDSTINEIVETVKSYILGSINSATTK